MHAGDATWYLHAQLTMLERRYSTEISTLELLAKMRENLNVIGQFIKVDPPPPDKLQPLIESVMNTLSQPAPASTPARHEQPQSSGGGRPQFNDPERIEAAKEILDEMVSSGFFDWADLIGDMHEKLTNMENPFVTDRQFRAIVNIGRKGDHGAFWSQLEADYPASVQIAEQAADNAT